METSSTYAAGIFIGVAFLDIIPEVEAIYAKSRSGKIGDHGPLPMIFLISSFIAILYLEKIKFSSDLHDHGIGHEDGEHLDNGSGAQKGNQGAKNLGLGHQIDSKGKFELGGQLDSKDREFNEGFGSSGKGGSKGGLEKAKKGDRFALGRPNKLTKNDNKGEKQLNKSGGKLGKYSLGGGLKTAKGKTQQDGGSESAKTQSDKPDLDFGLKNVELKIRLDDFENEFKEVLNEDKANFFAIQQLGFITNSSALPQQTEQETNVKDPNDNVDPVTATDQAIDNPDSQNTQKIKNYIMSLILLITLTLHGFLEGIALGYTKTTSGIWDIFIGKTKNKKNKNLNFFTKNHF